MTTERQKALRTGRNIGAIIGGIVFAVFGIVPAFYFGSFGTLTLLTHLLGPVEPGIIVRMILVGGIVLGLFCTAAVSIVVGSVLGTALAYVSESVAETFRAPQAEEATAEAQK